MSWWQDVWNERDRDAFKAHFTAEAVCIGGLRGRFEGQEAIADYQARTSRMSSDWAFTAASIVEEHGRFAVEWVIEGTHDRDTPITGPASGKHFVIHGASIGRRSGALIAEQADYWDLLAFYVHLGVVTPPSWMKAR